MGRKTQTSGASKDNGKKKSKADKTAKKSKSSSSPSSPPSSPEIARASIPEKKLLTAGHGIQMIANAVSRPANGDSSANNVLQQKATILSNQGGMVSLNSMKPGLAGPSRPEMIIPKRIAPEQQKPFKSLRSLTISNMNPNAKAELFQEFLMKVFVRAGGAIERTGNPIVGIEENFAKQGTAQVEFRSIEESLAGLSLQGINYGGKNIQVRRANESPNMANILGTRPVPVLDENYLKNLRVSAQVKDHADKLRVANLPVHLDEEDILSQIATLGALQEFYLVRDLQEFRSKGFAWARFADSVSTNRALVTKTFIDKTLITIRRVNEPLGAEKPAAKRELRKKSVSRSSSSSSSSKRRKSSSSSSDRSLPPEAKKIIVGKRTVEIDPREKHTRIVTLSGFLEPKELESSSYFEISAELEVQLQKFGDVKKMKILRKSEGYQDPGKVLVEFERIEAAILAKYTLDVASTLIKGMKFSGKPVNARFYDPKLYSNDIYE